jgi:hypothetical protein
MGRNGLAAHVGRETELKGVCGRDWKLARLTRGITRKFEEWAGAQLTSPVKAAREEVEALAVRAVEIKRDKNLDDETRAELLAANLRQREQITEAAIERSQVPLSARAGAMLNTQAGATHMLYLLLQKHQPDVTEDEAFDVLLEVGLDGVQSKIDEAAGVAPPKNAPAPAPS